MPLNPTNQSNFQYFNSLFQAFGDRFQSAPITLDIIVSPIPYNFLTFKERSMNLFSFPFLQFSFCVPLVVEYTDCFSAEG